jgi:hypothetical protein
MMAAITRHDGGTSWILVGKDVTASCCGSEYD